MPKCQFRAAPNNAYPTNLHTTFAEELVASPEGNLNDRSQLGQFLGGVGFDVSDTLEVG